MLRRGVSKDSGDEEVTTPNFKRRKLDTPSKFSNERSSILNDI
jgi:hypothetical protein